MKNFIQKHKFILALVIMLVTFSNVNAQRRAKKLADKDTQAWRYEIEAIQTGVQGTYLIKVWSYSKKPDVAIEQAKKNAVHGIIFRGFSGKNGVPGQKPLARNPNLENEKVEFFKGFFATGSKYLKFVSLTNDGAVAAGDRFKIGKKEYKIGVLISVKKELLRKDLEAAGIIKSMTSMF